MLRNSCQQPLTKPTIYYACAGFADVLVPCCTGKNDLYELNCGATDSKGRKLYKLCKDLSKAILFDGIHPTQATWKFIIKHLYASTPGFTNEEPELSRWIKKHASWEELLSGFTHLGMEFHWHWCSSNLYYNLWRACRPSLNKKIYYPF